MNWRKIICWIKGHKPSRQDVFVVERSIPLNSNEVIDGRWSDAIDLIAERYKESGHKESRVQCERCGKPLEGA